MTVDVINVRLRDGKRSEQGAHGAALRLLNRPVGIVTPDQKSFPSAVRGRDMDHYEFDYIGPHGDELKLTIAAWCEEHGCRLETTALLDGSRFSISGPEDRIRAAIRTVLVWIRGAA